MKLDSVYTNDLNTFEKKSFNQYDPNNLLDRNGEEISQKTIYEVSQENYNPDKLLDNTKEYYDDNGKLYRVDDELVSNNNYEINGYSYKTDNEHRIIEAGGKLHPKEWDKKLTIKDSMEVIGKGDQVEGDDRGHLIGDQFGGSNGMENVVAQNSDINQKEYKNFEEMLAKEMKDGKDVRMKIEPQYNENSYRPTSIDVTYVINGEKNVIVFPNAKE